MIGKGQYFETIHAAGIGWRDASSDIPSWIPNWTCAPTWPAAFTRSRFDPQKTFSSSSQQQPEISLYVDCSECIITGQELDRITHLNLPLKLIKEGNEIESLRSWLVDCQRMAAQSISRHYYDYKDEKAREAAFWRTLIAEKDDQRSFAAPEFEQNFCSYMATINNPKWPRAFAASSGRQSAAAEDISWWKDVGRYANAMAYTCSGRRFAVTQTGRIGLMPPYAREGDIVCIFFGAQTPVILRPEKTIYEFYTNLHIPGQPSVSRSHRFQLAGECYIRGVMHGDFAGTPQNGRLFCLC